VLYVTIVKIIPLKVPRSGSQSGNPISSCFTWSCHRQRFLPIW